LKADISLKLTEVEDIYENMQWRTSYASLPPVFTPNSCERTYRSRSGRFDVAEPLYANIEQYQRFKMAQIYDTPSSCDREYPESNNQQNDFLVNNPDSELERISKFTKGHVEDNYSEGVRGGTRHLHPEGHYVDMSSGKGLYTIMEVTERSGIQERTFLSNKTDINVLSMHQHSPFSDKENIYESIEACRAKALALMNYRAVHEESLSTPPHKSSSIFSVSEHLETCESSIDMNRMDSLKCSETSVDVGADGWIRRTVSASGIEPRTDGIANISGLSRMSVAVSDPPTVGKVSRRSKSFLSFKKKNVAFKVLLP